MSVRAMLEARERRELSPFASFADACGARQHEITEDDLRTDFQRDRDRILHAKSFRRLKHKTQVFLAEGDHMRTRLTHTLEVQQVARTIARALSLNEDLTEAIALGHDLGHTPFGHMGERTLNRLLDDGFTHRKQSVRVVTLLENGGKGLNLTPEVVEGILHHSGDVPSKTLEGQCVDRADRIAYINHDIDDALRAGVLQERDLPRALLSILGDTHGKRIDTMIRDMVATSADGQGIRPGAVIGEATMELRTFLFARVYNRPYVVVEEQKADRLLSNLFLHFQTHALELPEPYHTIALNDSAARAAADFVSGMTDRFALSSFESLFMPEGYQHL